MSDVGGLERKPRGNERVKVQSFFSREASLASLSGINRHLGNIVFVNGRKSIEKCRIALKSPTMLYPSKKAEPQKTSNHMMTKHWEYFPSFTRFFFISLCLEDALWRASFPLSKGLVQLPCDGDGYWLLVWKCCPTLKQNNTMNSDTCCPKLHYAAVVSFNLKKNSM